MKKVLQFAGLISLVLGVVAFILMMATPAVIQPLVGDTQTVYAGTTAIFGKTDSTILGDVVTKPSVLALIGWILLLVAMIIVALGVILPLFKVKALEKFSGILDIVSLACFVVGGIFMFLVVPTFYSANGWDVGDKTQIGAGWVIGGIIAIAAGAFAILPAAAAFFGKKK
jgi:hypothetical protein